MPLHTSEEIQERLACLHSQMTLECWEKQRYAASASQHRREMKIATEESMRTQTLQEQLTPSQAHDQHVQKAQKMKEEALERKKAKNTQKKTAAKTQNFGVDL